MSGGPVLRRGHVSAPPPEPAAKPAASAAVTAKAVGPSIKPALDSIVAVSDPKDRPEHDFSYHFASTTERAAAASTLEAMAQAVLANPALATDAPDGVKAEATAPAAPAPSPAPKATHTTAAHTSAYSTAASRAKARAKAAAPAPPAQPVLADEQMTAYQLYYSAPITYVFSARVAATAGSPERFVTVVATTDADGKLQPAMRTVTDAMHLDRVPRYRLIDVVDADGSNRASLLVEIRAQHSRQFALYRLLGNKPDQIFVSGSTLL